MTFFKGHGLGNDYVAMDGRGREFDLTPPAVRLICDRHRGVGSDGVLARTGSDSADFGVRIFNPDGSEAEKSGNGLRIFAAYLAHQRAVRVGEPFTVQTLGGFVRMVILAAADDILDVEVEMGRASFRSGAVGLAGPDRDIEREILELPAGDRVAVQTVSMGNPHCVSFRDELDVDELRRLGPQLATHPWFEHGTNVQFARAVGPGEVEALVWERGAGETMASGSSACAVAAAAFRAGLVRERQIQVNMPGGALQVTVGDEWDILLRGPVEAVCLADPTPGFRKRLRELS